MIILIALLKENVRICFRYLEESTTTFVSAVQVTCGEDSGPTCILCQFPTLTNQTLMSAALWLSRCSSIISNIKRKRKMFQYTTTTCKKNEKRKEKQESLHVVNFYLNV